VSWGPITPARIDFADPAAPRAPEFGDIYHSRDGAWGQARHVFLGGNRLPARWAGRERFCILETGFGLGQNFLAARSAWLADGRRPQRLWYLAIEKHPPGRGDLARALAGTPEPRLADELIERWPPLTPDMHAIDFDAGRVRLLLAFGDIGVVLRECVAAVDAFFLDGFAPARNPSMWDERVLRGLHRLAAPGSTLATWCVASAVRQALVTAGFAVEKAPGFGTKREMLVARFAPRVLPRAPPARSAHPARRVAIVGAGLAGAAAARAIAAQGIEAIVFDRESAPAAQTSGQPGGLLHGVVHAVDGPHARWLRAAALHAARDLAPRLAAGAVGGALRGLWRGERTLDAATMRRWIERLALPEDYVDARSLPNGSAAWWYPGGGWANPGPRCGARA
jgi:tRNA 5-methylaminomethyl-2-thiouridine biosynthesis bifunctional protein